MIIKNMENSLKNGCYVSLKIVTREKARGGGVLLEKLGRVFGPLPKTLTLFMTKICDFSYPIFDLTKYLIPYLWP